MRSTLRRGFAYSDCTVDDSRLVVLNAKDAAERGAAVWVGHRVVRAVRAGGRWQVVLFEDADRATEQAANALLKAIEEPAPRTVWLLCSPSAEDLVTTIRSRCRRIAGPTRRTRLGRQGFLERRIPSVHVVGNGRFLWDGPAGKAFKSLSLYSHRLLSVPPRSRLADQPGGGQPPHQGVQGI